MPKKRVARPGCEKIGSGWPFSLMAATYICLVNSLKRWSIRANMSNLMESWIAKIAAGLFATVMAPLLVAMGLKYSDAVLPPADVSAAVASATPGKSSLTSVAAVAQSATHEATNGKATPDAARTLRLFNGRDLAGFNTWLGSTKKGAKPLGLNNDPKHVFQVANGMLRISGEVDGLLITRQPYDNYALTVEYRWGDQTWGPRQDKTRTSGLLLHFGGKPGDVKNRLAIKCQVKEGATGDFVLFGEQHNGIPSLSVEAEQRQIDKGKQRLVLLSYQPGSPLTTISTGFVARNHRDTQWRDVKGFHGRDEMERPAGEWNTLECICKGDAITTRLNGETVNVGVAARPSHGRIALQSAGAEIFFRRIELKALR
jgi:hypothetical protein